MDLWISCLVTGIIFVQWSGSLLELHTYQCQHICENPVCRAKTLKKTSWYAYAFCSASHFSHSMMSLKMGKWNRKNNDTEGRKSKNYKRQVVRSTVVWAEGKKACLVRGKKTNTDNGKEESIKPPRRPPHVAVEA